MILFISINVFGKLFSIESDLQHLGRANEYLASARSPPSRSARQAEAEASNGVEGFCFCATSMAKMIATILSTITLELRRRTNTINYTSFMKP